MNCSDEHRDYTQLYLSLCDCAGPQPSINNPRADEHRSDCQYRAAVEEGDSAASRAEKC